MRRFIRMLTLVGIGATIGCDRHDTEHVPTKVSKPIAEWVTRIETLAGAYTRVMRLAEFWDSMLIVRDVDESLLWKFNSVTGERTLFGSWFERIARRERTR